jgi:hypothetical protein
VRIEGSAASTTRAAPDLKPGCLETGSQLVGVRSWPRCLRRRSGRVGKAFLAGCRCSAQLPRRRRAWIRRAPDHHLGYRVLRRLMAPAPPRAQAPPPSTQVPGRSWFWYGSGKRFGRSAVASGMSRQGLRVEVSTQRPLAGRGRRSVRQHDHWESHPRRWPGHVRTSRIDRHRS